MGTQPGLPFPQLHFTATDTFSRDQGFLDVLSSSQGHTLLPRGLVLRIRLEGQRD